jgi:hypothetical protein
MATTGDIDFQYKPLEAFGQFRLLALLPSEDDSAGIESRIVHSSIQDAPSYEALSYAWGKDVADRPILIDGKPFNIRNNLYDALRRLHLVDKARELWIDAICINQIDVEERNFQVAQMGNIYANAKEVAIWLGAEADESDGAMKFIPGLSSAFGSDGHPVGEDDLISF